MQWQWKALEGLPYSQKFLVKLIFKTFEDSITLLKIKIALYIGIDIRIQFRNA